MPNLLTSDSCSWTICTERNAHLLIAGKLNSDHYDAILPVEETDMKYLEAL
jgi:hypothetical protein